jgi:tetratricopeptide (TPR) repeat protein
MVSAAEATSLARQAHSDGDFLVARERYAEAARIYREQNDILAYAHTLRHLADVCRREGKLAEAKPLYEESLEVYRSNLDTKLLDLANTVRPYALLNEEQGDLDSARLLWEEARHLYGSLRIEAGVSEANSHIGRLYSED